MKLYLVQHGDALPKAVDPDRPLSDQGRADIARVAAFLNGHLAPARIVHSGKTRARQSAEQLAAGLAPTVAPEAISGIAPNDRVDVFAQAIDKTGADILLVGHLPFVSHLAAFLLTGSTTDALEFQPGCILSLASGIDKPWQLHWMLRPELIA